MIEKLWLLITSLSLVMTACTSAMDSAMQPIVSRSTAIPSDPSKTIFFPLQGRTDGERAVMEALIHGTLVIADSCIRVASDNSDTSYLLIWPPDFNINIENGKILTVHSLKII